MGTAGGAIGAAGVTQFGLAAGQTEQQIRDVLAQMGRDPRAAESIIQQFRDLGQLGFADVPTFRSTTSINVMLDGKQVGEAQAQAQVTEGVQL